MPSQAVALRFDEDAERAREDSLALWLGVQAARGRAPGLKSRLPEEPTKRALKLKGRYRVGDGNEFTCEITEMTPSGMRLRGPKAGGLGKWCTAHVASVGIVEGVVIEARQQSFVVGVIAPPRRLSRLIQRIHWRLLLDSAEVAERRASERIEMNRARADIVTEGGARHACEIFDVSEGGAAVHLAESALYFWVEQPVQFQGRAGRVLRHFPGGLVIKFDEEAED